MKREAAWMRALPGLVRSPFARNALALYGVGFTSFLFPLLTAPYLARVLHPTGWGRVALAQSFGQTLAVVVEYGFVLSATREIARATATARADVVASVLGAKAFLAAIVLMLGAGAGGWLPLIADDRRLVWSALLWAVGQGFHPLWYYQGSEQVRRVLVLDVVTNGLAIAAVVLLCRSTGDGWKVLAIQASAAGAVGLVGHGLALAELGWVRPSGAAIRRRLADGAGLFAYRLAVSGYTVANPIVLGLVAPATVVGYFAAAEKIVKTLFVAAIHPLNQALYPRASRRGSDAGTGIGSAIAAFGVGGIVAGAAVGLTAPLLVRVVFGPDFAAAVVPLRVLAALLPILAVSTALVMHRLLPAGRDRVLLAITVAAGVLNVGLACGLASIWGATGMAVAVVTVESVVLLAVGLATRRLA
ncbi:MAG: oligosaccharide flippase family protein [Candidatus Binatia bacterium]